MAEHKRRVGDTLFLNLQLPLLDTTKHVLAYLYDGAGSLLGSIELQSVGGGLYADDVEAMPNTDQVRAQYVVFDDPGFTQESCEYGRSIDVFDREELVPVQFPDEGVVGEIQSSVAVDGRLQASSVSGTLEGDSAIGAISEDGVTGTLPENAVTGELDKSDVSATLKDC